MSLVEIASLSPAELSARWRKLLVDPSLDDLPEQYRVELDQFGELIVSPRPANRQQVFAALVCDQLRNGLRGFADAVRLSIVTAIGVRIADGFWSVDAAPWAIQEPACSAPEVCIVVASSANSPAWLARKAGAFIASGAQEVVCVAVSARYFHTEGEHDSSRFVQLSFPLVFAAQ